MFIHAPVFIQLLGYAAGATCSLCFVAKRDITLRLAIGIGVLLFGLQYLLLGAVTAAIINFVNSGWQFLSMVSGRFPKRLQTGLLVAVCCVYIAAGILTWEGIISLLPMVSTVGLAIAVTVLSDRRLRLALLACDALWLVTGLLTHSQGAVVFAILPLVLNGWFLYRRQPPAAIVPAAVPAN
jgi:hypothetical protein